MAKQSSGKIETGFVDFSGEISKSVTFDLKTTGEPRFSSPPVVKVVSIERLDHLYKYLFFDRLERPVYEFSDTPSAVENFGPGQTNSSDLDLSHIPGKAHTTVSGIPAILEHYPYQNQYLKINNGRTLGFNFTDENRGQPGDSDKVYLYLQVWMENVTNSYGLQFGFMSTDSTGFDAGDLRITSFFKMDNDGVWEGSIGAANSTALLALKGNMTGIDDGGSPATHKKWLRLELQSGTDSISKLRGFTIKNTGITSSMRIFIANPIIVYGSNRADGFTFNPNVHVSFSNVTASGMTVECSAKLHGRIRFLMSV